MEIASTYAPWILRVPFCAAAEAPKRLAAASAADGHVWLGSYAALAAGPGRLAAADWALAQFAKLDAPARVEVVAAWLAEAKPSEK